MSLDDYFAANKANWNDRAVLHAQGDSGYVLDRYRNDRELISDVVAFDRQYLCAAGDLSGVELLHLQCHIGTDTLSLARLGANVTGLDQSSVSLDAARELFDSVDTPGRFVEANVYDAVDALDGQQFDLVYTSVGALNWLPDIARWGEVVGALVRPGGWFYVREGHPMALTLDDEPPPCACCTDTLRVRYPYFERREPMVFDLEETYVDTGGRSVEHARTYEWAHGIGEVFMALTNAGLQVTRLDEHRHLDWKLLPMQEQRGERFYLPDELIDHCPMQYSMLARRLG